MKPEHGLVIGKFYPPHAGHHHLVREAAARCERLTVLVLVARIESLELDERVAWMREAHATDENVRILGARDDHPVDYADDEAWQGHVSVMREALERERAPAVDVLYSSEAYGEELARRLGARHELVDLERRRFPVSGTAVRADPCAHWAQLAEPTRAGLSLRVVIVGAESTGKSTLAEALCARLRGRGGSWERTEWVDEAGRDLTLAKLEALGPAATMAELEWSTSDFVAIAREQVSREEAAARRGSAVLVCDTDAFATGIWHERYVGTRSDEVEACAARPARRFYLLTHHDDVPFVDDGARDSEHLRAWMTETFEARMRERGYEWAWLRGSRDAREARALELVDAARSRAHRFADPHG